MVGSRYSGGGGGDKDGNGAWRCSDAGAGDIDCARGDCSASGDAGADGEGDVGGSSDSEGGADVDVNGGTGGDMIMDLVAIVMAARAACTTWR